MLFFQFANESVQAVEGGMQTYVVVLSPADPSYYHFGTRVTDTFPDDLCEQVANGSR